MKERTNCEYCVYYSYDEDYNCYAVECILYEILVICQ
ncbi:MAG: hypothetical protein ACFWTJ_14185 [Lachnoclostridium sp.]